VGVVAVPDPRLAKLAALYSDAPIVPASVTFVDIAGSSAARRRGRELGNSSGRHPRERRHCQVVRVFHDDDVITSTAGWIRSDIAT